MTLDEINRIREIKRNELDLRVNTKLDTREKHILVCHGTRLYFFEVTSDFGGV